MMSDSRAFEGWRRLSRAVMVEVGQDDPAGLAQVRAELDELERRYALAMAQLAGNVPGDTVSGMPYSHGEIARALGVTRQAVSKRIKAACES